MTNTPNIEKLLMIVFFTLEWQSQKYIAIVQFYSITEGLEAIGWKKTMNYNNYFIILTQDYNLLESNDLWQITSLYLTFQTILVK